ncbi:MAG: type II toxin-antitoxin system VapC family toxin [Bifidobacteriaceae bacterium]|jgi:predicted nucleic acid-binding protein|nr:type II toxin-antitoxin system VapC family toxin [Bifidobacteriaceae bacterium]
MALVLDASAIVETLLTTQRGVEAQTVIEQHANDLHIPHLENTPQNLLPPVESFAGTPSKKKLAQVPKFQAPSGLEVTETLSALRSAVAKGYASVERCHAATNDLSRYPAHRWAVDVLTPHIWELRNTLSAYDATYIALAEVLGAELITCDQRLATAAPAVSSVTILSILDTTKH